MNDSPELLIAPLDNHHDRLNFNCGIDMLDRYIKQQAGQDIKRHISRVFVATTPQHPKIIVGYYTLSSLSIELAYLPEPAIRKLPKHPIPAALLGRLAVNKTNQGCGIGMLLVDSINRTVAISPEIGIYAIIVDAIDKQAQAFYQKFGFCPLNSTKRRLFLPLKPL